jgi:hypothetical protein
MWAQCRATPLIPCTYPIWSLAKGWSSAGRDDTATPLPPEEEEARWWSGGAGESDNGGAGPARWVHLPAVPIQGIVRSTSSSRGCSRVRHGSRQPRTNCATAPRRGSSPPSLHHRSTAGVSSSMSTTWQTHGPPGERQRHPMSVAPGERQQ